MRSSRVVASPSQSWAVLPPTPISLFPLLFSASTRHSRRMIPSNAGFRDLHFETLELIPMEFENGREYWEYSSGFSAAASVLSQIAADQHDRIGEEVAALAGGGNPNGKVALKSEALQASGIK